MNKFWMTFIGLFLLASCSKENETITMNSNKTFTVEGYLYSIHSNQPIIGRQVALSQESGVYRHSDPSTITNNDGYFKLEYKSTNSRNEVNVYPCFDDYSCIYKDISFVNNLQSNTDITLKRLLTKYY